MSIREDRPGDDADADLAQPGAGRSRNRRRRAAVAGAAGLAALVGVGAVVLATRDDDAVTRDTSAVAPIVVPSVATPSAEPTVEIDSVPGESVAASPAATASASRAAVRQTPAPRPTTQVPERVRKEIEEAREKASREGHPLQRALTTPPRASVQSADSLVEETRPLPDGGTMRITSARYDLSGQREMLLAADNGKPAGAARCTQNLRFAQNTKPIQRPNTLLCWRLTEDRSVVVLTVSRSNEPAQAQTLNALDAQWNRLG